MVTKDAGKKSKIQNYQLLTCSCEGTMSIDADKLAGNLGLSDKPEIYNHLCRSQIEAFENAVPGKKTIVTCTQEAPLFSEIGGGLDDTELSFVNIRENAGWSKSGKNVQAKMAALIAESIYEVVPTGLIPVNSQGKCLVYGAGQQAMDIAVKLANRLDVSLVLSDGNDVLVPATTQFAIYMGKISRCSGSIGKYECVIDKFAAVKPSAKGMLEFLGSQDGSKADFDLIFDLSGGTPLLGGSHGRDGYFHIEPDNTVKIAEAMFEIVDLVGEFEKPIFVSYDQAICAHSRSGIVGCTNCIDACPTSAISSSGEGIHVNNEICDGCGHCSSSCPTGAVSYAFPNRADLLGRSQALISTYLESGGKNPVILLHEEKHGGDLIAAMARFGDGLAGNVLPLTVHSITHIGHEALCGFFTSGAQSVTLLAPQKIRDELGSLNFQVELTNVFLAGMGFDKKSRVRLLVEDDPDVVSEGLFENTVVETPPVKNFTASKNKRETARLAISNLNGMAAEKLELLALPAGSPYGSISIDSESCTLCLACVGACPANALSDNPDRPQVSFTEHACVQCGLCKSTCPENAIKLEPQYNFDKSALSPVLLNYEEPLECSECGKPFGSRSAIEKVIGILQGKNPMFQTSEQLALLKMCDNCRIEAMAMAGGDPMSLGQVPRVMTADDDFDEEEEPTRH